MKDALSASLDLATHSIGGTGVKDAETLLNKSSDIQQSPRKLDQQDCQPPKPEFTKLDNFQDTPDLQHISTRAKAILVHVQIRSRMSSLLITPLPLTLSEDKIHRIIKSTTYSFSNLIVKIFCDKNNCPPRSTPQSQPMMKWVMSLVNPLTLTVMIPWHNKMWTCLECQFFILYCLHHVHNSSSQGVLHTCVCDSGISLTFHDFGIVWRNLISSSPQPKRHLLRHASPWGRRACDSNMTLYICVHRCFLCQLHFVTIQMAKLVILVIHKNQW